MLKKENNLLWSIFLFVLFLFSLILRIPNLNTPFWVDEFSTASQAKILLERSYFNGEILERNNFLTHSLVALSFSIFGPDETAARYPMVIIGSLIPILIFFVGKYLFDKKTALVASILMASSYIEIAWSRQARGYIFQQFFLILSVFFYFKFIDKPHKLKYFLFLISVLSLGLLTHNSFILIPLSFLIHFVYLKFNDIRKVFNSKKRILLLLILSCLITSFLLLEKSKTLINGISFSNNFAYYHSFMWREQTIISMFSFLGFLLLFKSKTKNKATLFLLILIAYLFFFSFIFSPYVSRYLLPIFPILFILTGFSISEISSYISRKNNLIVAGLITIFIIFNGDKFVLKPKSYYSVNHDMREIALVNYPQIYGLIKAEIDKYPDKIAIVDTWPDRTKWYLGENIGNYYSFRWLNDSGLVNGLSKSTNFELNENEEKILSNSGNPPIKLVAELSDLEKLMTKYEKIYFLVDDSSLPEDVRNYVEQHFKKEIYMDHYPLDDNPYSVWPITLYSWENPAI